MTNRRGIVGIAVLWIIAALSALAWSALAIARWQRARGRALLNEQRAIQLIAAALIEERDENFSRPDGPRAFATGRVDMERPTQSVADITIVRCRARIGAFEKTVDTGWRHVGDAWRAVYWREVP